MTNLVISAWEKAERELAEARAEIERLRGERAGDQHRLFHYEAEIKRLRADNEWLRKTLVNAVTTQDLNKEINERNQTGHRRTAAGDSVPIDSDLEEGGR